MPTPQRGAGNVIVETPKIPGLITFFLKIYMPKNTDHGRIVSNSDTEQCLDTSRLSCLEQSFRDWIDDSKRADVRASRRRILVIFLLIRYTGAKLNEVLALHPDEDIDWVHHHVFFRGVADEHAESREVQISKALALEIKATLMDPSLAESSAHLLDVDPGFVRRKFYERAEACGFDKRLGGPEMIRKARAVELMRGNMPLPAVQMILGHSTPNLTSSYVSFSRDEVRKVAKMFMEKESARKTSARNSFFGKIENIDRGDIQTRVTLQTIDGFTITTIITNDSLERLGLTPGGFITAEVKAPSVILHGGDTEPSCSAENRLRGRITRITRGEVNSEYVVSISEATEVCAVISSIRNREFTLNVGEQIWVLFNCFSVVLQAE